MRKASSHTTLNPVHVQFIRVLVVFITLIQGVGYTFGKEDLTIHALEQRKISENVFEFEGLVTVSWSDVRLQADYIRMDMKKKTLQAEGNVALIQGDLRVSGSRLEFNLKTNEGVLYEGHAMQTPQLSGSARTIFTWEGKLYELKSAQVTECSARSPHWSVSVHKLKIKLKEYVSFTHALIKIKGIPVLYIPYFRYSLKRERSTGFLFPQFGPNSLKGFYIGESFFWAIARNLDMTIGVDWYARAGEGLRGEFRYVFSEQTRGTLSGEYFRDVQSGNQWSVRWTHSARFGTGWLWNISTDWFSSFAYRQNYGYQFTTRYQRQRYIRSYVSGTLGPFQVYSSLDIKDYQFRQNSSVLTGQVPNIRISLYNVRFGPLNFALDSEYGYLWRKDLNNDFRFHRARLQPRLSLSFALPWLSITPSLTWSAGFYSKSRTAGTITGDLEKTPLFQHMLDSSVSVRGPIFYRIFQLGKSLRLKHVIEPFFTYRYSHAWAPEDRQAPQFDGFDRYLGFQSVEYGITQRFFTRKRIGEEETMPQEWLSWTVSQSIQLPSQSFDPAQYPYTPQYSALRNAVRINPSRVLSADISFSIHPKTWTVTSVRVSGFYRPSSLNQISLSYFFTRSLTFQEEGPVIGSSSQQIRTGFRTRLSPYFDLSGNVSYDFSRKIFLDSSLGIIWRQDCFAIGVQVQRFQFGNQAEWRYNFSLSIPHVGNIFQFMPGLGNIYY